MNSYEADPAKIPANDLYADLYADLSFYGRYLPRSDDFTPNPKYINSTTPEAIAYWKTSSRYVTEAFDCTTTRMVEDMYLPSAASSSNQAT
jgi:COMPASS component SPP1